MAMLPAWLIEDNGALLCPLCTGFAARQDVEAARYAYVSSAGDNFDRVVLGKAIREPKPRRGESKSFWRDRGHFEHWLRTAMEVLHARDREITRAAVAEAFRGMKEPKLRLCSDRRIREWCDADHFNVDFDALARLIQSAGLSAGGRGDPPVYPPP